MPRLAIIGSNDLGKLIAFHAIAGKWELVGFFDNNKHPGTQIENYGTILGNIDEIEVFFKANLFDYLMIGVGYTQFEYRKLVFEKFKGIIPFANIIHNSSYIDSSASLGEGIFILPGCVVDTGVTIDDNVLLNTGCTIAHHSHVKNHCFIAPGVTLAGNIVVNECCFLGVGSTILDNIHVVSKTLVGGGAVVIEDITESGTYVGVPAKRLKGNKFF